MEAGVSVMIDLASENPMGRPVCAAAALMAMAQVAMPPPDRRDNSPYGTVETMLLLTDARAGTQPDRPGRICAS